MKYLYLHGLGQNADSWNKVTSATEVSENSACLDLAEMVKGKVATYSALYSAFSEMCNAENEDIILCGLFGQCIGTKLCDRLSQKSKGTGFDCSAV